MRAERISGERRRQDCGAAGTYTDGIMGWRSVARAQPEMGYNTELALQDARQPSSNANEGLLLRLSLARSQERMEESLSGLPTDRPGLIINYALSRRWRRRSAGRSRILMPSIGIYRTPENPARLLIQHPRIPASMYNAPPRTLFFSYISRRASRLLLRVMPDGSERERDLHQTYARKNSIAEWIARAVVRLTGFSRVERVLRELRELLRDVIVDRAKKLESPRLRLSWIAMKKLYD